MKNAELGRTGLSVSRIGLGLAALGRPGYINLGHAEDLNRSYQIEKMEKQSHQVLDAAFENGVKYFDAARSYGRAESFLASWIESRKIPSGQITVGSKWGYTYTAKWKVKAETHEVKEHTQKNLDRQWKLSQQELGKQLDLYQIHSATLETGVLENRSVLNRLAEIKSNGTAIGLSVSGPNQALTISKALEVDIDGCLLFDSVQATWNLLEPSAGEALKEAHQAGMGVIIKEALANGRLTSRNQEPGFSGQRSMLNQAANRLETTLDALALAAVLDQSWVDVVLSGAARIDHLKSNLSARNLKWEPGLNQELKGIVETPENYWAIRSELSWG
jgi:aryl-alcohol dehydrogenase-like predicted oxidoreductase